MNNVVSLRQRDIPDDLMTFKEIGRKYGYKYSFLYKWSVLENVIPIYDVRGHRGIRESDLLKFMDMRTRKWRA